MNDNILKKIRRHGLGGSARKGLNLLSDCYGVPSSRKYDAMQLQRRVLKPLVDVRLKYRLQALRNKEAPGEEIYCHFILEIEK